MIRTILPLCALVLTFNLAPPVEAQSRKGELRGVRLNIRQDRNWEAASKQLKENGFNALFIRASTGGTAYYPSKLLPVVKQTHPERDGLQQASLSAQMQGVELYAVHVSLRLVDVAPEFLTQLKSAGRLQRNSQGQLGQEDATVGVDWLCPANPDNRQLANSVVLELLRNYRISGVQLESMQFPSEDYCFCDNCKARFARDTKINIERWPEDVQAGRPLHEKWLGWRRDILSSLVEEISNEVRRVKPEAYLSLGVLPDPQKARNDFGQDWLAWEQNGWFDFVCLTDHAAETSQSITPLYRVISSDPSGRAAVLANKIEFTRRAGADGFVILVNDDDSLDWLARLHDNTTAIEPDPMPHWSPPVRFKLVGSTADLLLKSQLTVGEQCEVSLSLGWNLDLDSGESANAEQAAAILRRAIENRSPTASYEPAPAPSLDLKEGQHISGKIVLEAPEGARLFLLGAFASDYGIERTLRFPTPEGPFRIAIYGTISLAPDKHREFVTRSRLLMGKSPEGLKSAP